MAHAYRHDETERIHEEHRVTVPHEHPDAAIYGAERRRALTSARGYAMLVQLVYLVFGIFEVLLVVRFVLKLGNANTANGVVGMLYGITDPLVRPFITVFPVEQQAGPQIEIAALLAIAFLVLAEALVIALLRALRPSSLTA